MSWLLGESNWYWAVGHTKLKRYRPYPTTSGASSSKLWDRRQGTLCIRIHNTYGDQNYFFLTAHTKQKILVKYSVMRYQILF